MRGDDNVVVWIEMDEAVHSLIVDPRKPTVGE